jgi:hypothetical protein
MERRQRASPIPYLRDASRLNARNAFESLDRAVALARPGSAQ